LSYEIISLNITTTQSIILERTRWYFKFSINTIINLFTIKSRKI
jgi:hypothetical protein